MRIEIRNDSVILDGYVNAVGRDSKILFSPRGRFIEQIVPKTFAKALLKAFDVDLLFNHMKDRKLGSLKQGNLELREDNIGLRAIATVTDPTVIEKARNGELRGWSFSFKANKDTWEDGSNGVQKRMVEDIDLYEVSILDKNPAYLATSIEARGEEQVLCENRIEDFTPEIADNSTIPEDSKEEKREENVDFSIFEKQITLLKLKGCLNK